MAVQDISQLTEQPRPALQPNPLIATTTGDGSRYLDALKRSVKPKPRPTPEAREKPEPRSKPEPTRERPKPDVERSDRSRIEPEHDQAGLRDSQHPSCATHACDREPDDSTRIETADANVRQETDDSPSNRPAGETTTDVVGDVVSPPPAGFVDLFAEIQVDAKTQLTQSALHATDEPTAPTGLAALVNGNETVGGPISQVAHPGDALLEADVTTVEEIIDPYAINSSLNDLSPGQAVDPSLSPNSIGQQTANEVANGTVLDANPVDQIEQQQIEESQAQQIDYGAFDATAKSETTLVTPAAPQPGDTPGHTGNTESSTGAGQPGSSTTVTSTTNATTAAKPGNAPTSTPTATPANDVQAKDARPVSPNGSQETTTNERSQFAQRVVNAVRGAVQGNRSFKAVLHPPELGVLQVEITSDGNGKLIARLEVHTQAAQQALQDNLNDLRAALGRQGITLERIEIQLNEPTPGEDRTSDERNDSRQEQQREESRESKEEEEHAETPDK